MKITIIGWYGTETIGDRAILAGLFSFFAKVYEDFEIKLGSLYPFFSERTINEDYCFYKELVGKDFKIDIFNSKDSKELVTAIKDSDLVVMGGGPLMDLSELFMVEYAFKKAKKHDVKTALLGCGVGPLFKKKFKKSVLNIVNNSDIIILRDNQSKDNLKRISKEFSISLKDVNVLVSLDPAVECCIKYKHTNVAVTESYIAVNLRAFPAEYSENDQGYLINNNLSAFIKKLSKQFSGREIRLIPMSYFYLGCDDREFLNEIILKERLNNVFVQNKPLTLKETIQVYHNAYFNIGMRFHSVVFQTIISGKNFILDYTEPKKGKIYGFIKDIDKSSFYDDRYVTLQDENTIEFSNMDNDILKIFTFKEENIDKQLSIYTTKLNY